MIGLPKNKRDVEFTFDYIPKNSAFPPKRYLFPVTSKMFIFLSKPIFFVLNIPLMANTFVVNSLPEKYIKLRLLLKWS